MALFSHTRTNILLYLYQADDRLPKGSRLRFTLNSSRDFDPCSDESIVRVAHTTNICDVNEGPPENLFCAIGITKKWQALEAVEFPLLPNETHFEGENLLIERRISRNERRKVQKLKKQDYKKW
jgi:hypothetical protein